MSRRQPIGQRVYTEAQRQEALALAERLGSFAAAGRQLEIPDATLRRWAAEPSRELAAAEASVPGELLVAEPVSWTERRAQLVPRLGQVAAGALEAALLAIEEGKARNAQAFAITAGILIDKAQLLAGGATSRSESTSVRIEGRTPAEVTAEVQRMREQLGYHDVLEGEVVE